MIDNRIQKALCRISPRSLNEKGIALVLVLILAMISLAIVASMLFMVTQGTVISGAQKFYRTADEASTGAAELTTEYMANRGVFTLAGATNPLGATLSSACNCGDPMVTTDNNDLNAGGTMTPFSLVRTCRCDKLCNARANWAASGVAWSCDDNTGVAGLQIDLDPSINPDFSFELGAFTVDSKIVDTVLGNSDLGGVVASGELGGSAVSAGVGGIVTPPHSPYLYRMDTQAVATANPRERSRMSVLYGY